MTQAAPTISREDALDGMCNRLFNFKFTSAARYLKDYPDLTTKGELIRILARNFGNCGCLDGDMGALICCSLESIPCFMGWLHANPNPAYQWGLISEEEYQKACKLP